MDAKLSAAIQSGQHMYQALQSTGVEIAVFTAYKYADKGYFSFTSLDLPRKVKFKSRKKKRMPYIPPAVKKGALTRISFNTRMKVSSAHFSFTTKPSTLAMTMPIPCTRIPTS